MFTENGKGTIFDNVKAKQIVKAHIPEDEIIKPTKLFSINKDKFDSSFIVDEYKMPSFKYLDDNSLNDFYDYPEIYMSQNPEYRYKYPKLSTAETIKAQWQTEEGTPNELNTFIRQDETGKSLEDIQKEDTVYREGLNEIQKMIDEKTPALMKSYNKGHISEKQKDHALDVAKQVTRFTKRYNPVTIKPAIAKGDNFDARMERENKLLNDIRDPDNKYLLYDRDLSSERTDKRRLNKSIKEGKQLKSISHAPKPPIAIEAPSPDLPTEKIPNEMTDADFKKAILEGKNKLKDTKAIKQAKENKYNEEKSNRYENLEKEYKEESKRQIAHENLVLKGYDEVISKLESLTTNKLSKEEREEINDMLKKIDNTNIGAINQVETAIKRLRSKQEKIEEHKTKILDRIKKQEAERKAPRRVSRSSNIMQVSDLAKNDDESDFSIKKKIKTRPHFSGLSNNKI
jgi:hypothetical protein